MEYSYRDALREDILEYLNDANSGDWHKAKDPEDLYDSLFVDDGVTGNASGSYWCNSNMAKECVLGDPNAEDYIREAISGYGMTADEIATHFMDWEYWDVIIRCELLGNVLDEVLKELKGGM
ncbi:MAG: hypothetical protein J6Y20_10130 [Lachnospiraceae bacterium]|nr:hypothetical protein [Lachnospiraceae bacterium]MBP5462471.1 hypothetical protein [Lachnospiraceae bacterium]